MQLVASYDFDSWYSEDRTGQEAAMFYLATLRAEFPEDTFEMATDSRSLYIYNTTLRVQPGHVGRYHTSASQPAEGCKRCETETRHREELRREVAEMATERATIENDFEDFS